MMMGLALKCWPMHVCLPRAFCSPSEILWPRSRIVKQRYARRQATMVPQLHPSTTVLFKHVACTLFIKSLKGHLT